MTKNSKAVAGRRKASASRSNLSLFGSSDGADADAARIEDAEKALLDAADFTYARTSLKPMSKALFFLSRALVTGAMRPGVLDEPGSLAAEYQRTREQLGEGAPLDDFDFSAVVSECGEHLPRIMESLRTVLRLTGGSDKLGLAFNTLLRGKWESGEGLGTYLTPEEVVAPMVTMLLDAVGPQGLKRFGSEGVLFGDICGGSGRFSYALAHELLHRGVGRGEVEQAARLFDQSSLAVGFAKVNFALVGLTPSFSCVGDSLLADEVSDLAGRFLLLATNPPFGVGKYEYSPALKATLPSALLGALRMNGTGDAADPAELFLYRNLALLAPGGALAIVLPDGVVQSPRLPGAIRSLESTAGAKYSVLAAVSLPAATFALGGTVAKTSFLVVRRNEGPEDGDLYVAVARHVGFLKRGNRRVADPNGNELPAVVDDWRSDEPSLGRRVGSWRGHDRIAILRLLHGATVSASPGGNGTRLRDVADHVRLPAKKVLGDEDARFHLSILDVDETGLIDVIAAGRNEPATPPLSCQPGDVLVSCINPRIWRVAVVPDLEGAWSCSSEFLVLRPKEGQDPWALGTALHRASVIAAVQSMAGGTSSSRQRVAKDQVLDVEVPGGFQSRLALAEHVRIREEWYWTRLREGEAYDRLHGGEEEFDLEAAATPSGTRPRSSPKART